MANLKNAKKKVLVDEKKEKRNNNYLASTKTAVKNVEKSVLKNNKEEAQANLKIAIKRIDKATGAHVMDKNASARKKSRLTKKVNAM